MSLEKFQKLFSEVIQQQSKELPLEIIPGGRLNSQRAFEVYQKGYIARLTEALGETFEAVWWVLGDEQFFSAAKGFISQNASHSYNLSDYGERFQEFLPVFLKSNLEKIPFLTDLCRFEILFKKVFHLSQHSSIQAKDLQKWTEDSGHIVKFGSTVFLFDSQYSVYDIWKNRSNPDQENTVIDWDKPQKILLYKKETEIFINVMEDFEYFVLQSLDEGKLLVDTLEDAEQKFVDISPERVSELFQFIFHSGIIERVESAESVS